MCFIYFYRDTLNHTGYAKSTIVKHIRILLDSGLYSKVVFGYLYEFRLVSDGVFDKVLCLVIGVVPYHSG
jgi:hypothetical protein